MSRFPYQAAAFLASFLAFELELLTAKLLLPPFGGGAFVWTMSMMFFQGLLLCGYLYAGWARGRAHAALLAAPLLFFPIASAPVAAGPAPAALLWTLLRSAAAPFFALSTTSLVIQDWLSRSDLPERSDPYFIYGASNAGALAGLLCYPFLVEPLLALKTQSWLWCALYLVCAALTLRCRPRTPAPKAETTGPSAAPGAWVFFSAASSAAMLACSNSFAYNLAAAPLLWVLPLSIYLATFYLAFKRRPWDPPGLGLGVVLASLLMASPSFLFSVVGRHLPVRVLYGVREFAILSRLLFDSLGLFVFCLFCHRALALSRPSPRQASRFYVMIALGGWLGSALIAVLVPLLARHVVTLSLDWGLAAALALLALALQRKLGPAKLALGTGLAGAVLAGAAWLSTRAAQRKTIHVLRNFYGIYEVADFRELRKFYHGNTTHGMQFMDRHLRPFPMSYYHPHSPLGELYETFGGAFRNVGAVGLGVGSIAAYGKPGQTLDFYELDGDVLHIAQDYFSYLKDSRAKVDVILGDARLSLSRAEASYDFLVLDAFTSDAIPLHLLTEEAFEVYMARLAPKGLIACHISNRLLDLKPVLANLASALGLHAAYKESDPAGLRGDEEIPSRWVVLSRRREDVAGLVKERGWRDIQEFAKKDKRPWTDQYASIIGAIAF